MAVAEDVGTGSAVGAVRPRVDAGVKVTGRAAYAADVPRAGLLHGRPVLSPYAHARILSVDTDAALEVPGVRRVLLADDLPIKSGGGRGAEPLARSEVVFAGQPVALVLADTEAAAEDGAEAVFVDYEPLPAVVDVEAAIVPGSPLARVGEGEDESDVEMHGAGGGGQAAAGEEPMSANVFDRKLFADGDVEAALAGCAAVAEGTFRIPWVHQGYLEPQVATAWPDGDGGLSVYSSTQAIFWVRGDLARLFDLSIDKVRVEAATLGGGFGAKLRLVEPLVAAAALAVDAPVRVLFTRTEDFAAANPAPGFVYKMRIGANADGTLAAIDGRILIDGGAFTDSAPAALAGSRCGGPYAFQTWRVESIGVKTNRFGAGAYRGPTSTQSAFVVESLLDELADALGIDRVELRLRNEAEVGTRGMDGGPRPRIGFRETLEAVRSHPLWAGRAELPPGEGVGLAVGMFPGAKQGAGAVCRMDADGGVTVISGYVDMTGTDTGVAAIAAETFGVSADKVRVVATDTATAPHAGVSGGSMVTYCLGNAVHAAAQDAREQLLRVASQELEIDPSDLEVVDGEVRPVGSPDKGISLATIGAKVTGFGPYAPIEGHGTGLPPELAPSVAVALAHVRVDDGTGQIELLDYVAAQDVGRAINPALCEGQMRGGAAQSIGFALCEQLVHDEEGTLLSGSFMNYAMPKTEHLPPIETIIVEVPAEYGPLGAKGIGESAMAPGAAAVVNAVAAATGVRFRDLPMTPDRVWRALAER